MQGEGFVGALLAELAAAVGVTHKNGRLVSSGFSFVELKDIARARAP